MALTLYSGGCGGGYTEAAMILAGLLSGIAADIWPSEYIDRKRFVELWSCYADPTLATKKISVPLLVQSLQKNGDFVRAEKLEASRPKMFGAGYSTRILVGDEVDMSEEEVLGVCSDLDTAIIRSFSYGTLFYEHVRCGLVHEFHLSEDAVENPMTRKSVGVSYSNQARIWPQVSKTVGNNPFAQLADPNSSVESAIGEDRRGTIRLIHFNIQWVTAVVQSMTSRLADLPNAIEKPTKWWIEGR